MSDRTAAASPRAAAWALVCATHALLLLVVWRNTPGWRESATAAAARDGVVSVWLQVSRAAAPSPPSRPRAAPLAPGAGALAVAPAQAKALPPFAVPTPAPAPRSDTLSARSLPIDAAPTVLPPPMKTPVAPAPAVAAAESRAAPLHEAPVQARPEHAHCARAPYPPALHERGIEGVAQVRVQVSAEGRALEAQLAQSSGWHLFDQAALSQVLGCRYLPARRDGQAVRSWVEFPVRFALAG